jgi:hypothetical protein
MLHRLILICCILLMACGPTPSPATEPVEAPTQAPEVTEEPTQPPEATEVPSEEPETSWENPYERTSTVLCPEDKTLTEDPVELPIWEGDVASEELGGQQVFVRRGLYANSENEIFQIDVIGVSVGAVNNYIDAPVKICLDYLTTETIEEAEEETPPSPGPAASPFGDNPGDLIIKLYVQGLFNPEESADRVRDILQRIVDTPVKDWEQGFNQAELPRPDGEQDFVIDFIIDPTVNSGATHQYQEQRATKIFARTSVRDGSGSVVSGICRGRFRTTPLRWTVVTVTNGGIPDTAAKSDNPGTGFAYPYDLGVKGNDSGEYRISGRWFWPGWSANYWEADPATSLKSCDP